MFRYLKKDASIMTKTGSIFILAVDYIHYGQNHVSSVLKKDRSSCQEVPALDTNGEGM